MATAQVAILQIQIVEGEGAVYAPGARSTHPLTVAVTDEAGRPVAGAAVTFQMPEDGPSGVFANGLRTEVANTDERGRATLRGLQMNRMPGKLEIRIIASKEQARAGTVSFQYIAGTASDAAPAGGGGNATPKTDPIAGSGSHGHLKWIAIAAGAGGGAAAAAFLTGHGAGNSSSSSTLGTASAGSIPLSIGAPTITVGKQ
jgi:hypothetical protein